VDGGSGVQGGSEEPQLDLVVALAGIGGVDVILCDGREGVVMMESRPY
jgi:hypothetical protein